MIKHKYDLDAKATITEIDAKEELEVSGTYTPATLETEEGLSKPAKFVLVDISDKKNIEVIVHNLDSMEQQEACEVLEKILFGETYDNLEENSIRISKPKYTDFDH